MGDKKIIATAADLALPYDFTKQNVRIFNASILTDNTLNVTDDLDSDESFCVDLENIGEEVPWSMLMAPAVITIMTIVIIIER